MTEEIENQNEDETENQNDDDDCNDEKNNDNTVSTTLSSEGRLVVKVGEATLYTSDKGKFIQVTKVGTTLVSIDAQDGQKSTNVNEVAAIDFTGNWTVERFDLQIGSKFRLYIGKTANLKVGIMGDNLIVTIAIV